MTSSRTYLPTTATRNFETYSRHYARVGNRGPNWSEALRNPRAFACRKPWLTLPKDACILDFGCGWGRLLLALWCAGFRNLEGVEISSDQAEAARAAAEERVPIHHDDGMAFVSRRHSAYDLIIVNDVIEHIPPADCPALLEALWQALKPGGRLVIQTPNMSSLLAPYSRYIDVTHVNGFTEWSLIQALELAGFTDHRIVSDTGRPLWKTWRPWAPWRGLGIRHALNVLLHRFVYALRAQSPRPTCFSYNLEMYTHRPATPVRNPPEEA